MGHVMATFHLKNNGPIACTVKAKDQPLLLNGNDTILINGPAAGSSATLTLAPGGTLSTDVQTGNRQSGLHDARRNGRGRGHSPLANGRGRNSVLHGRPIRLLGLHRHAALGAIARSEGRPTSPRPRPEDQPAAADRRNDQRLEEPLASGDCSPRRRPADARTGYAPA
jgi:hypothetical protein